MYPLHDKDLDRLSRNAAEHYEVDFGSSGWEQLEKRLDQELPPPRNRRRFLFWLFFIVVTTGSALIGLLIGSQPARPYAANNIRAMAPVNRMQDAVANSEESGNKFTDRNRAKSADEVIYRSEDLTVEKSNNEVEDGSDDNKVENRSKAGYVTDKTTPEKVGPGFDILKYNKSTKPASSYNPGNYPKSNSFKKSKRNRPTRTNNLSISDNASTAEPTTEDRSFKQLIDPGNTTRTENNNQPDSMTKSTASIDSANQKTPDSSVAKKADKPKIPHTYKQNWEFAVTAGPDASMVEFGPLFKAGYNFGVQIGYRFNERWSVNTGLIYTRKYYQADSNTFHAPKRSSISYVKLDALKGFCQMFDIPLNVRYDIAYDDKRRLFASAGASTYLMNRQYYDCYFRTSSNPLPQEKAWDSKTSPNDYFKKNYLFAVMNLSAGYERTVNKRFSIQAEPYIKIPLTGMGYGTMKIGSYGMFFSLKYHPSFKSVPK